MLPTILKKFKGHLNCHDRTKNLSLPVFTGRINMDNKKDTLRLIGDWNQELKDKSPVEVIGFFIRQFKDKVVLATSMGVEDQVLTQMVCRVDKSIRILTLDTGRLFQETYDLIERTNEKYGINIEVVFPDWKKVQEMVREKGINLFYRSVENRKLCCRLRKDESLKRALGAMKVWICGLRRDQMVTRFFNQLVEWDEQHDLIKVNPLIGWTEKQVWDYIRIHDIPYNILHDKNYPSIGCLPCTRPVQSGENSRAGRWWWEESEHKECGLHNRNIDTG